MEQTGMRLPIRLVPRKGSQVFSILFFAAFFGFAVFWTVMAADIDARSDWGAEQSAERWLGLLFPFFGVPFMLIGLAGMARGVLKLLPGSPYYHLEIGADGLLVRSLFKRRHYAWRELPSFETLERQRRTKNGTRIEHYTVATENVAAMENVAPPNGNPAGAPGGSPRRRELLRILADEYGAKNGKLDADALTDWLNRLHALAAQGRLDPDSPVEVPEGFRASVRPAADARDSARVIGATPVGRSAPVIEQSDKRRGRTVVRR